MGRLLVLLDRKGKKHPVPLDAAMAKVPGVGTFDTANLRASIGRRIRVGDRSFLVLLPSGLDLRGTMERGPQTLAPKDLAAVLFGADVVAGSRVIEAGTGSGALTVALARAVGPFGRVISYDLEDEPLKLGRANAAAAGVESIVEFRKADIRRGVPERALDAVLLDIADPWAAVGAAWEALKPCGHFESFSPNVEQVKETTLAIRARPFVDVRTIEVIEREIEVREVGVRPSFAPLGHTGYLTFARKVLDTF